MAAPEAAQHGTGKMENKATVQRPDKAPALSPSNNRNAQGRWFELRETVMLDQDPNITEQVLVGSTSHYTSAINLAKKMIEEFPFKEISIIACDLVNVIDNPSTRSQDDK